MKYCHFLESLSNNYCMYPKLTVNLKDSAICNCNISSCLSYRYRLEDYDGKMLTEAESIRHKLPAYISPYTYKDWGTGVCSYGLL